MRFLNFWVTASGFVLAGSLLQTPVIAAGSGQEVQAVESETSPETVIQTAIDDLTDLVNRTAPQGPRNGFHDELGETLAPYVDVPLMSRLAVGKHWRSANPEQRERLTREYRDLLIATYSVPLRSLRNSRVSVRAIDRNEDNSRARVRVDVEPPDEAAVVLLFKLYRKEDRWLVYDMSVEGVSLTTNYRSEFASIISRDGLDGLIAQLADKNDRRNADARSSAGG